LNTKSDSPVSPEDIARTPAESSNGERESAPVGKPPLDGSRPFVPSNAEPVSDDELERGILDAVRMGLSDVARTLSAQLEERRRGRAGNVVTLRRGAS
jgi:hypothetical protein